MEDWYLYFPFVVSAVVAAMSGSLWIALLGIVVSAGSAFGIFFWKRRDDRKRDRKAEQQAEQREYDRKIDREIDKLHD